MPASASDVRFLGSDHGKGRRSFPVLTVEKASNLYKLALPPKASF
jgi:hypothetical protein